MECSTWWSQLPDDLKLNALAWLPSESLCRYRGVCKEWNALFSSTKFITNEWVAAPPNNKPWLVMCHDWRTLSCMAYCFFTNTWKRFPLTFLRKKYDIDHSWIHRSAPGLFLASIAYYDQDDNPGFVSTVSNPLTGTSLELPSINDSTESTDKTIKGITVISGKGHGQNGETYKVAALVKSGNAQRIEIYDSCLKSWNTAGYLPENFKAGRLGRNRAIVVSEDLLYYKCKEVNSLSWGIGAFSVQNGTSIFIPLPLEDVARRCDVLFSCGSRVLLGTCIRDGDFNFLGIVISELEKPEMGSNHPQFKEIARMPQFVLEDFQRKEHTSTMFGSIMLFDFEFEGVRDLVCIRYGCVDEVLVYNISKNIWKWLPICPIEDELFRFTSSIFTFEPRLDMKVEKNNLDHAYPVQIKHFQPFVFAISLTILLIYMVFLPH